MDGWPTTFEEYVNYLCIYSHWIQEAVPGTYAGSTEAGTC